MKSKICIVCGEGIWWDDSPNPACADHTYGEVIAAIDMMKESRAEKALLKQQAAQHRVEPTAPAAKRNSRKSTGTVSSKRRGGSR